MSAPTNDPFSQTLRWLAAQAGFPTRRLKPGAELLVCFAMAAASDEEEERQRFLIQTKNGAQTSALKAHGLRRSLVHFKCDNSAKV